jgi:hypothetical protein
MADTDVDKPSGLGRYDERIEELVNAFSNQVERIGGKALDELAASATRLAQRLEGVAEQARLKRERENASPEHAEPEDSSQETEESSTSE